VASNAEKAYEQLKAIEGEPEGAGDWFEMTQERINTFADVTEDHQFIHVDPERAAEFSPWKVPIAHGFLTLSLLTHLSGSIPREAAPYQGVVKVGSRIRATSSIKSVDLKDANNLQITRTLTVEIENDAKPACVADWITRMVYS
jgi:acyl dehydratase